MAFAQPGNAQPTARLLVSDGFADLVVVQVHLEMHV